MSNDSSAKSYKNGFFFHTLRFRLRLDDVIILKLQAQPKGSFPSPESDEKRKAALFSFHEAASSGELCWLMLVVRIPMFSGSFCK